MNTYTCSYADLIAVDMCSFRNCTDYRMTYFMLATLFLNENQISHLHEDTFIALPNIQYISLQFNNITSIPYLLFSNNHKLKQLDLNDNNINKFITELSHLQQLRSISLVKNPIETFHEGTLKTFFMHNTNEQKMISLDNLTEHLKCYCNREWLIRIEKYIVVQKFYISYKLYNLTDFLELYDSVINKCNLNNTIDILINTTTNNIG